MLQTKFMKSSASVEQQLMKSSEHHGLNKILHDHKETVTIHFIATFATPYPEKLTFNFSPQEQIITKRKVIYLAGKQLWVNEYLRQTNCKRNYWRQFFKICFRYSSIKWKNINQSNHFSFFCICIQTSRLRWVQIDYNFYIF